MNLQIITVETTDENLKKKYAELVKGELIKNGYSASVIDMSLAGDQGKGDVQNSRNDAYRRAALLGMRLHQFEKEHSKKHTAKNDVFVLVNSSTAALADAAISIENSEERRGLYLWLDNFNYQILGLTRPIKNFILSSDNDVFYELGKLFPKDYENIDLRRNGNKIKDEDIAKLLYERVAPYLPEVTFPKGSSFKKIDEDKALELGQVSFFVHKILGSTKSLNISLADTNPSVYMPRNLSDDEKELYKEALSKILTIRQKIISALKKHSTSDATKVAEVIDMCTPLALTSEVNIMQGSPLDTLTTELSKTAEGRGILTRLNSDAAIAEPVTKKKYPKLDLSDNNYGSQAKTTNLLSYSPRNELDTLTELLFSSQAGSADIISDNLNQLPYNERSDIYIKYLPKTSSKPEYQIEGISAFSVLPVIKLNSENESHQSVTPRYGYDVPEIIEKNGLTDDFLDCFDLSLSLYSKLQANHDEEVCTYACLGGHKVRWLANFNVGNISKLGNTNASLANELLDVVEEKHPLTAQKIRSVIRGN